MNAQVVVQSLKSLQARVDAAKEAAIAAGRQVADAKQSYHASPDTFNKALLAKAEQEYSGASNGKRKADEALRIFLYQRKTLNAKGQLVRL